MEKLNFKEMLSKEEAELHNSNMQNIVSAIRRENASIEIIEQEITWRKEYLKELESYGEVGNMQDTTAVSNLFNKKMPVFKAKRW
jgi:hypothetical protein